MVYTGMLGKFSVLYDGKLKGSLYFQFEYFQLYTILTAARQLHLIVNNLILMEANFFVGQDSQLKLSKTISIRPFQSNNIKMA
jgi:hypothetical protein